MLTAGMFVMAEVELRENPWATAGKVVGFNSTSVDLVSVQWPELPEPVWELGWTLREVFPHGHRQPTPDSADLAADKAGL